MHNSPQIPESLANLIQQDAGLGIPEISNRDMACFILQDLDYEAQLIAISNLLRQHEEADAHTTAQIREVAEFARKSTGVRNQRAVDEWIDLLHGSTYMSAAYSMAAVGTLAPFIESMFSYAFQGIRERYYVSDAIPPGHLRSGMATADDFWNCHLVYVPKKKYKKWDKNIALGIMELATDIGLLPYLPLETKSVLEALFHYRNEMFHGGFEWPDQKCATFEKTIAEKNWQSWFSSATRGGVPYSFFMTSEFIGHTRDLVDEVLEGLGAYCRKKTQII